MSRIEAGLEERRNARIFVAILGVLALVLLAQPVIEASSLAPIRQAYNEGWNAYHALSVREGRNLYPHAGSGLANNYPPVSFWTNAMLSKVFGNADLIVVGRFVALAALLAVVALLYSLLRAAAVRRWLAACVALGTLCIIGATARVYVAMNDPQWLAQALTLGAAVLLVRRRGAGVALGASAVLMLAGEFVKNALLAIPAALALWLLIQSPRSLLAWLTTIAGGVALAVALCLSLYGPDFLHGLLGTPRVFSLWLAYNNLMQWRLAIVPGFAASVIGVGYLLRHRPLGAVERFVLCYWVVSVAWAAVMLCGAGIWINALFEPLVACALIVGLALESMVRNDATFLRSRLRLAQMALVVAVSSIAVLSALRVRVAASELRELPQRVAETRGMVARLAKEPGPVNCETLSLCFWAGRRVDFDYFNLGQAVRLNRAALDSTLGAIQRSQFGLMQFANPGTIGSPRFPRELNDMIGRHYQVALDTSIGVLALYAGAPP